MPGLMNKRNRTKKNQRRVFYDGAIDIKRWKAKKRTERFVNRVGRRTVRLVAVLIPALLAAAVLICVFWPVLSQITLFVEVLRCVGILAAFLVPCIGILIPVRLLTGIPSFIFRKLMHTAAFVGTALLMLKGRNWQAVSLTFALAAVGAFVVLSVLEKEEWYGHLLVQKSVGEVRRGLTMYFAMAAILVALCDGLLKQPGIAAVSILMWGAGDAAAALIGIPFGKHKVKLTGSRKSWEGSMAMLTVSFTIGLCMLLLIQKVPLQKALLSVFVGALLGTATELFSPSEYDTITVPVVIAAALILI